MTELESVLHVETAICNVLRVSGPGVQPGTRLIGDLGARSIDLFSLGCDLQKAVNTEIDLGKLLRGGYARCGEASSDLTVQELARYLKSQVDRPLTEGESPAVLEMWQV